MSQHLEALVAHVLAGAFLGGLFGAGVWLVAEEVA